MYKKERSINNRKAKQMCLCEGRESERGREEWGWLMTIRLIDNRCKHHFFFLFVIIAVPNIWDLFLFSFHKSLIDKTKYLDCLCLLVSRTEHNLFRVALNVFIILKIDMGPAFFLWLIFSLFNNASFFFFYNLYCLITTYYRGTQKKLLWTY